MTERCEACQTRPAEWLVNTGARWCTPCLQRAAGDRTQVRSAVSLAAMDEALEDADAQDRADLAKDRDWD
jgi:hypothetical protein